MKKIIQTDAAPKAIGPYSQAVRYGEYIFCSGQIPLDPKTMEVVGVTATEQAKQALENLKAVLEAAESDFSRVVKTTLFLKNLGDFVAVNEVYASYFPSNPPARSTIEVARLPKNVLIEIECIAHL
ncbi:RidA family protein [Candidatus Peregrinibacteria bacterium]|nr:RidA family protein [Candidatus Peregrinibacteria bacterium]